MHAATTALRIVVLTGLLVAWRPAAASAQSPPRAAAVSAEAITLQNDVCRCEIDGGSHGVLTARAYREFGLEGAKAAILAVPTGMPDPAGRLLDVIEFAKGGFGCVELSWWKSTPGYEPDPKLFADGLAGMKRVADKIHAAGLQLGLHAMQGMVGWGPKDDPYLVPKADPRLLQDRHATLAAPLDAAATEIRVQEPIAGSPGCSTRRAPTCRISTPERSSSSSRHTGATRGGLPWACRRG